MKRITLITIGLLFGTGVWAQSPPPADAPTQQRIEKDVQRNENQQHRIEQGVKSGALTPAETARLEAGQARVEGKEARAMKDGKVTAAEQRGIQRSENRQSRKIHRKKHNARRKK